MLAPGDQLGRFKIISLLGEGGMGTVFIAEDSMVERRVALKVLKPELCQRPDALQRFFTEARAVNRIRHEHIVDVTELATTPEGVSYYVMELLQGDSLSGRLKKLGQLPPERAAHIVCQVADSLAASHEHGIVHRDLKPDNIFLISRGGDPDYVKLLDFGIAKLVRDESENQPKTQTGALLGTAKYMSPEQCLGRASQIDHRTDVYALGIILYQLMVGRVPYEAEGWGEILVMHIGSPFPSLRESVPTAPMELEQVVMKATAKQKEHRWASMAEMRDALVPFARVSTAGYPAPRTSGSVPLPINDSGPTLAPTATSASRSLSAAGVTGSPLVPSFQGTLGGGAAAAPSATSGHSMAAGEMAPAARAKGGAAIWAVAGVAVVVASVAVTLLLVKKGDGDRTASTPPAVAAPSTPLAAPTPPAPAPAAVAPAPPAAAVPAAAAAPEAADAGGAAAAAAPPAAEPAAPPPAPVAAAPEPKRKRPAVRPKVKAVAGPPAAPAPAAAPAPKAPERPRDIRNVLKE